jgi:hypothetical protein
MGVPHDRYTERNFCPIALRNDTIFFSEQEKYIKNLIEFSQQRN